MRDKFQPLKADRTALSFDKREILETQVLPTARQWLQIAGLRQLGETTLAYWGESFPEK
tara:strand:- start:191 stop:367 length:177 start_codon:yes stop_codon:yes gene_type:complete